MSAFRGASALFVTAGFALLFACAGFAGSASGVQADDPAGERRDSRCVAQCADGDCANGEGLFVYEDCARYTGAFSAGRRNGAGVYEYPNGDQYSGEFQNDLRAGRGEYRFKNGDVFRGEFHEGLPKGRGTYRFADGREFEGEFARGWNARGALRSAPDAGPLACEMEHGALRCDAMPANVAASSSDTAAGLSEPAASSADAAAATTPAATTPAATTPGPIAAVGAGRALLVLYAGDDASVFRGERRLDGYAGLALFPGDRIESGARAVDLQGATGVTVRLRPRSALLIPADIERDYVLVLLRGSALIDYDNPGDGPRLQIRSAGSRVSVDGTTFVVELDESGNVATVRVYEGEVTVAPDAPNLERFTDAEIEASPELKKIVEALDSSSVQVGAGEQGALSAESLERAREADRIIQEARALAESAGPAVSPEGERAALMQAIAEKEAELAKLAEQLSAAPAPVVSAAPPSPQEQAERKLLIQIDERAFEKALGAAAEAAASGAPTPADQQAAVRAGYETRLNVAVEELEKSLETVRIQTTQELLRQYRILEVVSLYGGQKKAGSVVAQAGDLLILHAPDGVFRIRTEQIEYVEYFSAEDAVEP